MKSAPETVTFTIRAPTEDWQMEAMEERGGLLLGDLIVGGISILAPGEGLIFRVDIDDQELGEFGIGRMMRDLDLPPS